MKESSEPILETHIFEYDGNLYGKEIKVEFLQKCREEEVEFILSKVVSNTNSLPKAKRNKPLQGSELSSLWIDEPIRPEGFWISPVLCVVHDLIDAGHHTGALQILIHMFQSS